MVTWEGCERRGWRVVRMQMSRPRYERLRVTVSGSGDRGGRGRGGVGGYRALFVVVCDD